MKILILGAAGFIGKNLSKYLLDKTQDDLVLYDKSVCDYSQIFEKDYSDRYEIIQGDFLNEDFYVITKNIDVVYHLISTTLPNTPMKLVAKGVNDNVAVTSKLLEACVENCVKKVIFLSSGGTVYGIGNEIPYREDYVMNPISAYGLQKLAIEKMLYLYNYLYGLNYRIIRLSNPYGPYQNPNGVQGVVTTFLYNALCNKAIHVYGDGSVIRDYIYIDDVVSAIEKIAGYTGEHRIFNLGSGIGKSIKDIIVAIEKVVGKKLDVQFEEGRKVDVPINILDITRYEECFGTVTNYNIEEGICKTMEYFMKCKHV